MTVPHRVRAPQEAPAPPVHPGLSVAMIATPLVWLAAEAISPALRPDWTSQLAVIAEHPIRWYWYSLLLVIGSMVGVPASIGLLRLGRARMRRVGTVGGVLVTLGFLGSVIDCALQLLPWQVIESGADRRQMAVLLEQFDEAAGVNGLFMVTGIGLLVGTLLLTTALTRHPGVSSWAALAFGAGVYANVLAFGANSIPALAVSYLLLLAGMGGIGVRLLQPAGREHGRIDGVGDTGLEPVTSRV